MLKKYIQDLIFKWRWYLFKRNLKKEKYTQCEITEKVIILFKEFPEISKLGLREIYFTPNIYSITLLLTFLSKSKISLLNEKNFQQISFSPPMKIPIYNWLVIDYENDLYNYTINELVILMSKEFQEVLKYKNDIPIGYFERNIKKPWECYLLLILTLGEITYGKSK